MYLIIRTVVIPLAFIGWIIFQLAVKKKKLKEIEGDIKLIVFFIGVWALLYFVFFK